MIKKILVVFAVLGLCAIAEAAIAQETWSIGPVPPAQVAAAADQVTFFNASTCQRLSTTASPLTDTCTQAQACTNAGAAGGASCTPAQARAANARIFPATQAGREEYVTFTMVIPTLDDRREKVTNNNRLKQCKFWQTATAAQRNAICSAVGLPAGCDLSCPGF